MIGGDRERLTQLIAPVITGLVTIVGIVLANRKSQAVRDARTEEWQNQVNAKLDEHNEYGRKFGTVSEQFTEMSITLARVDERLKNLEERK